MSLWDLDDFQSLDNDLQVLIEAEKPDWGLILSSKHLLTSFRMQEKFLIDFLIKEENINELLKNIFEKQNNDRICVQLFLSSESPLTTALFNSKTLLDSVLLNIKRYNYLQLGHLCNILTNVVFSDANLLVSTIITPRYISCILKRIDCLSIITFLKSMNRIHPLEKQWYNWTLFKLLSKKLGIPDSYKAYEQDIMETVQLIKDIKMNELATNHILKILLDFVSDENCSSNFKSTLGKGIYEMYHLSRKDSYRRLLLNVSKKLPPNSKIARVALKNCLSSRSHKMSEIESLGYIAAHPFREIVKYFDKITERWLDNSNNSFHCQQYVSLISRCIGIKEVRRKILKALKPIVLGNTKRENWRVKPQLVCTLLQIAELMDEYIENDKKWEAFRNTELSVWKEKSAHDQETSFLVNEPTELSAESLDFDNIEPVIAPRRVDDQSILHQHQSLNKGPASAGSEDEQPVNIDTPVSVLNDLKPLPDIASPIQPVREVDLSFENFINLVNSETFDDKIPNPKSLFEQHNDLEDPEKAYNYIASRG